ncbi:MAG TPA: MarR family transcriptional regulator [Amycolatopsis sp.]|nr:MarR family transcriptional regulator [Amycolatopsis sp.]
MTTTELGLAEALVRLAHTVQHVFGDVSREQDLTPQQAQLLCVLIREPVGMTELTRLLHLEKSSLTGLVDRVERRGLVTRVPDDRDRRACRIALTDEGVELAHRTHEAVTNRLDARTRRLPAAARSHVLAALDALS